MGQQHPELGLIQPEASGDITFTCGKVSGEGLGRDLDFWPACRVGGLCLAYASSPPVWDSLEEGVSKEAPFLCGCGSLWPLGCWWW